MKALSPSHRQAALRLRRSVRSLNRAQNQVHEPPKHSLSGQPFDRLLLEHSPLYQRSRALFYQKGGSFHPSLLSSPRSLSSGSLVSQRIEYTPSEAEILWTAQDPIESRTRPERLLELRTWTTSLFHEQNHRVLWKFLPPAPTETGALSRYLHFAESLVVMLDMALADHLGPQIARPLYEVGSIYDPGTRIDPRHPAYRTFLQAAAYATYLNLELFVPEEIPRIVETVFPRGLYPRNSGTIGSRRAAERALRLDRSFIESTNPLWQQRHLGRLKKPFQKLQGTRRRPLLLPEHPLDASEHLPWMQQVLALYGLS
jgi:hypothetical protein